MTPSARILSAACCLLAAACAHIEETVSYRIDPLERPRTARVETGHGQGVSGVRQALMVQAQVYDVTWCALEHKQRARGWKRVERAPVGHSLSLEWLFGGVFTLTAGSLLLAQAWSSPDRAQATAANGVREVTLHSETSGYVFVGAVGAIGLGLLTGAAFQQASLGRQEADLGEKELDKRDPEFICKREPAHGGRVRLTLADGMQLEADADASGLCVLLLPLDIEARLAEGRRATLEVIGDARAQVRIGL